MLILKPLLSLAALSALGFSAQQNPQPTQLQPQQQQTAQQQGANPQPEQVPVTAPTVPPLARQTNNAQTPADQPQVRPQTPSGCATMPKSPAPKGFHITIPKVLRTAIDKERSKLEEKTGVHVPTPEEMAKQAQAAPYPQPVLAAK